MPGLRARSPFGGVREATDWCFSHTSMFLSLFLSHPSPFSENKYIKYVYKKEEQEGIWSSGTESKQDPESYQDSLCVTASFFSLFFFWSTFSYFFRPWAEVNTLNVYLDRLTISESRFQISRTGKHRPSLVQVPTGNPVQLWLMQQDHIHTTGSKGNTPEEKEVLPRDRKLFRGSR